MSKLPYAACAVVAIGVDEAGSDGPDDEVAERGKRRCGKAQHGRFDLKLDHKGSGDVEDDRGDGEGLRGRPQGAKQGARASEPNGALRSRRAGGSGGQSTFADVEEAKPVGSPKGS